MFKIGDFSRITKTTVKTLHYYDKIGLLRPYKIDAATGYRFYSAAQIRELNRIIALKELGFSLEEILRLIYGPDTSALAALLEAKSREISQLIRLEQERLSRINALRKLFTEEDLQMTKYDVVIKAVEPIFVASARDFIDSPDQQGALWKELGSYIQTHNAKILDPCMVIYYTNDSIESQIEVEVVEPINIPIASNDRIKVGTLAGNSQMACVVHQGPYQKLPQAYTAISRWIEENQYEIVGPHREVYLDNPATTNDPEQYITEIQFPVRKVS